MKEYISNNIEPLTIQQLIKANDETSIKNLIMNLNTSTGM